MRPSSRDPRNDAKRRRPELPGTGHTKECLGMDSGSARESAPLANLAVVWHGVDCDVARTKIYLITKYECLISKPIKSFKTNAK